MLPYKELTVWKKSFSLTIKIYAITKLLPEEEKFGLVSQMRRCAVSIPSNIAEGNKRVLSKNYAAFLRISHGSGAELETQLLLVQELNLSKKELITEALQELDEIMRMLDVMIKKCN